jgi:hypothetical protein
MAGIGELSVLTRGISHVTATRAHALGDRCTFDGNRYVYVYNASSDLTAKQGYAMIARASTDFSCVISADTGVSPFVGVVQHVDIPVGEYGWILERGFGYISAGANTGLAAGDMVCIVGTTNTGNMSRQLQQTAYSNQVTPRTLGVVQIATATGGLGEAYFY